MPLDPETKSAIKAFNEKPKKGIAEIIRLCMTAEAIVDYDASKKGFVEAKSNEEDVKAYIKLLKIPAVDRTVEWGPDISVLRKRLGATEAQERDIDVRQLEKELTKAAKEKTSEVVSQMTGLVTPVTKFFHNNHKELNLHALGEFFGEEENQAILRAFANQSLSSGLGPADNSFDSSLRHFLSQFRLPGEAQKIDRVVEAFGEAYSKQNTNLDKDKAYVTAYATVMLNTNLHNPSVRERDKMSLQSFKSQLKEQELPDAFVESLYNAQIGKPLKLGVDEVPMPGYKFEELNTLRDKTFDDIKSIFSSSKTNVKDAVKSSFPEMKDIQTAEISSPRSWLKKLMGYEGTITIKSKGSNPDAKDAITTIQLYKPSIFSREKTRVIVQPGCNAYNAPTKESIEMASAIASKFTTPVKSIEATYNYSKQDMTESYMKNPHQAVTTKNKKTWLEKIKSVIGRKSQNVKLDSI